MKTRIGRIGAGLGIVAACLAGGAGAKFPGIDAKALLEHIKVLSSDEFEGRGPGTPGEEKSVAYLVDQVKTIGLKPGNPDGTYVQDVPLVGFRATSKSGALTVGGTTIPLKSDSEWMAVSRRPNETVMVDHSDIVFVGYGVVAPEYGWDDYKGVDVRGKTIVMLINDPAVPDPADAAKLDPATFKGRAMTYYGRWTYKYEIAAEKGAAAALIVHETGPAGYPFQVVVGSWGRENFDVITADRNAGRAAVEGWLALDTAKALFSASGQDFDSLKAAAARRDFKPVSLGGTAKFEVHNAIREIKSQNVVAKLEGSDPALRDEYVAYSAHWDHLGRDANLKDDQIFNGAVDNASGCASVLEMARAFTRVQPPPKRSILFLFVTAEEKGLLGAKYYASNPLYPLTKTVANLNFDGLNMWGRTEDVVSVGLGNSTLDEVLADAAKARGRTVEPDAEPEKGFFYRSDHFEFAKRGVPALDPDSGTRYVGKPADYGQKVRDHYTTFDYHKVSDQVKPDWDFAGAVDDLELFLEVGYAIANEPKFPEWKTGSEFKARREEMLKSAR